MDEPTATPSTPSLPIIRHDGWTGEKMAIFCETLAETAVVAEACEEARMGISGAYAARRRNPVFAAAWDAALSIARERLADTLLARSMEGNIEQIWRDGELVGERHVLDNRLGLAILRRLDRIAEGGVCVSARDLPFSRECRSPSLRREAFNWEHAIEAMRAGDDEGVAHALALANSYEVEEVEAPRGGHAGGMVDHGAPRGGHAGGMVDHGAPRGGHARGMVGHGAAPNLPLSDDEDEGLDLSHRCWKDGIDDIWMTDFPPPAGFTGYESRLYDEDDEDERYVRACTEEEVAILEADAKRARDAERAEEEDLRDTWFALLREDVNRDRHAELVSASIPETGGEHVEMDPGIDDDR